MARVPKPRDIIDRKALAEVLPDTLTPKDALELIYRLKALTDGEGDR